MIYSISFFSCSFVEHGEVVITMTIAETIAVRIMAAMVKQILSVFDNMVIDDKKATVSLFC